MVSLELVLLMASVVVLMVTVLEVAVIVLAVLTEAAMSVVSLAARSVLTARDGASFNLLLSTEAVDTDECRLLWDLTRRTGDYFKKGKNDELDIKEPFVL